MKWLGTLLVWIALLSAFSLYNFPANIYPSTPRQRFMDNRVFHYNFSMASPSFVSGNFSVRFNLASVPDSYLYFTYTNITEQLNSVSSRAGQYLLNWTIYGNGEKVISGFHGQVWQHYPYSFVDNGEIPDICCRERDNFTANQGNNLAILRFTIQSNLTQSGTGYYWLAWGPFVLEVQQKTASPLIGWAFELIAGAVLFPASYLLNTSYGRWKNRHGGKPVESNPSANHQTPEASNSWMILE